MYLFFFKSWAIGNILLFLHRLPKQTACHSTHYWQGCGETVALSSTTGLLCNPRAQQRVRNITCDHCIFAEFVNLVNEVNEALKLQSFDLTIPFLGACLKEITGQEIFFSCIITHLVIIMCEGCRSSLCLETGIHSQSDSGAWLQKLLNDIEHNSIKQMIPMMPFFMHLMHLFLAANDSLEMIPLKFSLRLPTLHPSEVRGALRCSRERAAWQEMGGWSDEWIKDFIYSGRLTLYGFNTILSLYVVSWLPGSLSATCMSEEARDHPQRHQRLRERELMFRPHSLEGLLQSWGPESRPEATV